MRTGSSQTSPRLGRSLPGPNPTAVWIRVPRASHPLERWFPGSTAGFDQGEEIDLGGGMRAKPLSDAEPTRRFALALLFNLGALGFLALFVAAFLIYQSSHANVARRAPANAQLAALGVTATTLRVLFVGEGALLGLCGTALGVACGWAFATLLLPSPLAGASGIALSGMAVAKGAASGDRCRRPRRARRIATRAGFHGPVCRRGRRGWPAVRVPRLLHTRSQFRHRPGAVHPAARGRDPARSRAPQAALRTPWRTPRDPTAAGAALGGRSACGDRHRRRRPVHRRGGRHRDRHHGGEFPTRLRRHARPAALGGHSRRTRCERRSAGTRLGTRVPRRTGRAHLCAGGGIRQRRHRRCHADARRFWPRPGATATTPHSRTPCSSTKAARARSASDPATRYS